MPELANAGHELFGPFRRCVGEPLGHYVYALIDSRDGSVFYIGKGQRERWSHHLRYWKSCWSSNAKKKARIASTLANGGEVVACIIVEGLDKTEAFRLERRLIARTPNLTNLTLGSLSARDRSRLEAQVMLDRLVPWSQWKVGRPQEHIEMHKGIVQLFAETAIYGAVIAYRAGESDIEEVYE